MGENPYKAPKSALDASARIGLVLVSCRDMSHKDRLETMDQSPLFHYLFPLWGPFIAIGFLALGFEKLGLKPSTTTAQIVFGLVYVVLSIGLYWIFLKSPVEPSLVLHEAGFRFNDTVVAFEELTTMRFGGKLSAGASALKSTNQFLGRISPRNAAAVEYFEQRLERSMTLVFKDGREQMVGGMLSFSRPEDLEQFFERLRSIRPELVEEPPAFYAAAPSVDDLPFRMTPL